MLICPAKTLLEGIFMVLCDFYLFDLFFSFKLSFLCNILAHFELPFVFFSSADVISCNKSRLAEA